MMTDTGVVRVRFANIYKFPVAEGNVITSVVRGTKVQIIGEEGNFFKIDFANQMAYIGKTCIAAVQ